MNPPQHWTTEASGGSLWFWHAKYNLLHNNVSELAVQWTGSVLKPQCWRESSELEEGKSLSMHNFWWWEKLRSASQKHIYRICFIIVFDLVDYDMSVKMNKDFCHFFLAPNTHPLLLTWPLSKTSKTKITIVWQGDSLPELKQNRELERSQWEIKIQSKRWYPRNLRTYCLLESLIHIVANKKIVLCQHGETDWRATGKCFVQHITLRTTNLALLPKTNAVVIILKKYQSNGRCRFRLFFLHYKDPKIRLLVYASCLKSFNTEKQWVLKVIYLSATGWQHCWECS